jgi:hypothetical protein
MPGARQQIKLPGRQKIHAAFANGQSNRLDVDAIRETV